MLKFILKMWPAFLPIIFYLIYVFFAKRKRKKDLVDAKYKIIENHENKDIASDFSLQNNKFVVAIFLTFALIISMLIFLVFTTKNTNRNIQKQEIIVE